MVEEDQKNQKTEKVRRNKMENIKDRKWVEEVMKETFYWAVARAELPSKDFFELKKKYFGGEQ